jgi:hypothetical protein
MLNTIRLAINGYKSPATNFVSQTFKSFLWATNPRPNVIEYYAKVTERFSDPDFGVANYDNEEVICVAQWDESMWNPSTGAFTSGDGSVVPNPTSFAVYNVRRATIVGQKVSFDGVIVDPPPYLYLPLNVNAPLEVSVIQYPPVPSGQGTGVGASLGLDTSVGSKGWAVTLRSGAKQSYTQNGSLTCAEGRCA